MPIKEFSVTRERPIFLPSRRPPASPASTVIIAKEIAPPKPKEPEQPQLSLVGTIAGGEDYFGIFVDQATKAVLRLRVGEHFQGWKLQSVKSREVAFQRNQESFVVSLPQPGLSQVSIAVREEPGNIRLVPVNVGERRGGRQ
jgi:general secretion pathway protein N